MSRKKTLYVKGLDKKESIGKSKRVIPRDNGKDLVYYCYIFKCKGCEKLLEVQNQALKRHSGRCRSCSQRGLPYEASYNELLNRSKSVPHLKNRPEKQVELSYEEYANLCEIPDCHYCGSLLNRYPYTKRKGKEHNNGRSSMLDRKVNNLPYSFENCVPCCWRCNQAKSDNFTYEEWFGMTEYLRNKNNLQD